MLLPYNHKLIVFFCRQIIHTNENQTIGFSLERGNAYHLNDNKDLNASAESLPDHRTSEYLVRTSNNKAHRSAAKNSDVEKRIDTKGK